MVRWLEKRFGLFAIPNLTLILVGGQVLFFLAGTANPALIETMTLDVVKLRQGEWWRLLSFIFMPKTWSPIFFIFAAWIFYIMGAALEEHWGAFRYNLFLLVGYLATIATVWIAPAGVATNAYLLLSVLLAFAFLFPDFTIMLFLILPVKVKWIGLFFWMIYGFQFLAGDMMTRIVVAAAVLNFLLFFWPDLLNMMRRGARTVKRQAAAAAEADEPFHTCVICGKTERSHPNMEFRYCPQCQGAPCYCEEHIHQHEHR